MWSPEMADGDIVMLFGNNPEFDWFAGFRHTKKRMDSISSNLSPEEGKVVL